MEKILQDINYCGQFSEETIVKLPLNEIADINESSTPKEIAKLVALKLQEYLVSDVKNQISINLTSPSH